MARQASIRQAGIEDRITRFVDNLHALYVNELPIRGFLPFTGYVTAQYGFRNCKIVIHDSQSAVYCFIDLSNGDILKAATWSKPATGARGNIWNDDCDVRSEGPANLFGGGLYK